jgi:hypothetical protein
MADSRAVLALICAGVYWRQGKNSSTFELSNLHNLPSRSRNAPFCEFEPFRGFLLLLQERGCPSRSSLCFISHGDFHSTYVILPLFPASQPSTINPQLPPLSALLYPKIVQFRQNFSVLGSLSGLPSLVAAEGCAVPPRLRGELGSLSALNTQLSTSLPLC